MTDQVTAPGTRLVDPVTLAGRTAPSRVIFGPHETNLGRGRALASRHVAYYTRRAAGGAGIVVTETASVHPDDWPYDRAPLAADCTAGWAQIAQACRPYGTLVLAGIGHTGAQGSSAYSQAALWAPSRVADSTSRELPMEVEQPEIDALVEGFAAAAARAAAAGLDGVEVDAGPSALLRQFHSGLTNQRSDRYGQDRLALTRDVLTRVRAELGDDRVLALRLCCDELAPWAGVTPEHAAEQAVALAGLVDLLVVTRGGPFSASAYRPDGHTPAGFNRDLAASIRTELHDAVAGSEAQRSGRPVPLVALQGSVVDPGFADEALGAGAADLVEMTRALIADADLVAKVRAGTPERVRPCVLCNQTCRARDNRNPVVTCITDPRSGHETKDPDPEPAARTGTRTARRAAAREVLVVGAGPAGLEAARVLAGRGYRVTVADRADELGGTAQLVRRLPGRDRFGALLDWWRAETERLGVTFALGTEMDRQALDAARGRGAAVVLATGSEAGPRPYAVDPAADVRTDVEVLAAGVGSLPDGPVVVLDLVGGPIGLGLCELAAAAGRQVTVVTADPIVGVMTALSGDLADGNTRLLRAGVTRRTDVHLREARAGSVLLADRYSDRTEELPCAVLVHCGHRLPQERLHLEGAAPGAARAGDCVAPRTLLEAVLEGRRAADAVAGTASTATVPAILVGAR